MVNPTQNPPKNLELVSRLFLGQSAVKAFPAFSG